VGLSARVQNYLARLLAWLGELWPAWATVAVIGAFGYGLWYVKPCDLTYRLIGMVAQLVGLGIAIWALLDVRLLFGLPRYRAMLREWWSKRPSWRNNRTIVGGIGGITTGTDLSSIRATVSYNRNASTEERLNQLTDAIEGLQRSLGDIDARHTAAVKALRSELGTLSDKTAAANAKLDEKMKSVQTGGVAIALVGAVLVAIGTVLTAVPVEVAYFMGNLAPNCKFP
jgi:hypothetical protein